MKRVRHESHLAAKRVRPNPHAPNRSRLTHSSKSTRNWVTAFAFSSLTALSAWVLLSEGESISFHSPLASRSTLVCPPLAEPEPAILPRLQPAIQTELSRQEIPQPEPVLVSSEILHFEPSLFLSTALDRLPMECLVPSRKESLARRLGIEERELPDDFLQAMDLWLGDGDGTLGETEAQRVFQHREGRELTKRLLGPQATSAELMDFAYPTGVFQGLYEYSREDQYYAFQLLFDSWLRFSYQTQVFEQHGLGFPASFSTDVIRFSRMDPQQRDESWYSGPINFYDELDRIRRMDPDIVPPKMGGASSYSYEYIKACLDAKRKQGNETVQPGEDPQKQDLLRVLCLGSRIWPGDYRYEAIRYAMDDVVERTLGALPAAWSREKKIFQLYYFAFAFDLPKKSYVLDYANSQAAAEQVMAILLHDIREYQVPHFVFEADSSSLRVEWLRHGLISKLEKPQIDDDGQVHFQIETSSASGLSLSTYHSMEESGPLDDFGGRPFYGLASTSILNPEPNWVILRHSVQALNEWGEVMGEPGIQEVQREIK